MTNPINENALQIFADGEIEELSPLMEKSVQLKTQADAVKIDDKESYVAAKATKRELSAHRTSVKGLRLALTRKLDDIKSQFIGKQEEVLAPVLEAELELKQKIVAWEEEQRRIKEEEENRIQGILDKLTVESFDRKTVSRDEVVRAQAALKMELGLLDQKDKNKKAVKDHVAAQREILKETLEFVDERDRQAAEAEALAKERAALDAEKAEHEAAKANETPVKGSAEQSQSAPVSGPAKASSDIDKASDDNSVDYNWELEHDLGADVMASADKILKDRLEEIRSQDLSEDQYAEWRAETIDTIYQVIKNNQ